MPMSDFVSTGGVTGGVGVTGVLPGLPFLLHPAMAIIETAVNNVKAFLIERFLISIVSIGYIIAGDLIAQQKTIYHRKIDKPYLANIVLTLAFNYI